MLWKEWWKLSSQLRGACSRTRNFFWMIICLAGMTIRMDLLGVTSIVRALGLLPACYDRILDFLHSPALNIDKLTRIWRGLVFKQSGILRFNGRPVLIGDGIKVAKSGRKMPAVKKLHQQSDSNTKPEYIFGHSCQAVAILMKAASSVFAVPLSCRIHEGVVFSNRDKRTLLDKMIVLVDSLGVSEPIYFAADAYYASGKIVRGLLKKGDHLITRVKKTRWPICLPSSRVPMNQIDGASQNIRRQNSHCQDVARCKFFFLRQKPHLWRNQCYAQLPESRFAVAAGRSDPASLNIPQFRSRYRPRPRPDYASQRSLHRRESSASEFPSVFQ
jgi:hypothetical protein